MFSMHRALILFVAAGILGLLSLLSAGRSAAEEKAAQQPPPPPPAAPRAQRVIIQGGAAVLQVPAPADDPNKSSRLSEALTFPTDRKAKRTLNAAQDFIKEEAWGEAARVLQSLLDAKEDVFVEVPRDGGTRWTSLRNEANRLIGTMPANGRAFYELQYGARAKDALTTAKTKGDPHLLADVALRYLHTDAGAEASNLLGTYHLDRGRYVMAGLCFERLLRHEKADQLSPATLIKALLAFRQAGDKANADETWKRLAATGADVRVGDQKVSLDQLRQELDRLVVEERATSPSDWAMYRGNPSRSARGDGTAPFLDVKWMQPTIRQHQTELWVNRALRSLRDRQQAVLPAYFPIAATVRTNKDTLPLLVYRSFYGIHAVDLRNGLLNWESPSTWSLDRIAEDSAKLTKLSEWMEQYLNGSPALLLENATIGTLSSDNARVYAVDDLPLPPHPQAQPLQQLQWGGQAHFGTLQDAVEHNRLQAFELATGKLVWELGGRSGDKGELNDCYFLGPPLPLGGKLYALTEKSAELRLVCLDAPKGDLTWTQPLGNLSNRLLQDPGRRIHGVSLAYGDGVLVCPTNAGAVLGVDLLSHSLVWAHSYREEVAAPVDPANQGMMRRGGMMAPQVWSGDIQRNLNSEWKAAPPIVQDGRVVFTAPDSAAVSCLNLRDGTLQWKKQRDDDLYLAGVFHGKVLLVGRSSCRALDLADGRQLWRLETGLPSGEGVAGDNVYYLPLQSASQSKEPEVCSIDLEHGAIIAHTKSRKKEVPGNLLFYEGDVVSQTATAVTAYPQLQMRLAQIDEALRKDPNDPVGLTDRGELKLDQGKLQEAVEDLRTALAHRPPPDILPRARTKLFETLTELFQRDFNASEPYLAQYRDMCKVVSPADATADQRHRDEEEQERRQANFLCLLAKGREKQGRLSDAFQAYLEFGALTGNRELVSVIDEPTIKARPDVWAQGRIAALMAHATPDQRKPLEARIAEQARIAHESKDPEGLRRFVMLFGAFSTAGRQARFELAERLLEEKAFLDAELQLLQLRRQGDPPLAGRAVELLARIALKKGLLEDAAYWYRLLGQEYAKVVIRDGKTGADFFNELATDKRLLPYLDEPRSSWPGRWRAKELPGGVGQFVQTFPLEPEGEVLPFFRRHRFLLQHGYQLKVVNQATGEETWTQSLSSNPSIPNYLSNTLPNVRFPFHLQGHLAIVNWEQTVCALDPVDHKLLWRRNLSSGGPVGTSSVQVGRDGALKRQNPDGSSQQLGRPGPVEASYVCLHTAEGLVALDPLSGSVLWMRSDVPPRAEVFGDDQFVYYVEMRPNQTVGAGRALRVQDGVSVEVPDFGPLYQHRLRTCRGALLLSESDAKGLILRLYDIASGQDRWKRTFPAKSLVVDSDDPDLTAVLEPTTSGKLTVLHVQTAEDLMVAQVDPKEVEKVQHAHLLHDADRFYLTTERESGQNNAWRGPWSSVQAGIRWIKVNGMVYAFDRGAGQLRWKDNVPGQALLLDQFADLPLLLFTARSHRAINNNPNGINRGGVATMTVKSIEKRTGKVIFDHTYENHYANQLFHAIVANRSAGTIDLVSQNWKIQHYLEEDPRSAENQPPAATSPPKDGRP